MRFLNFFSRSISQKKWASSLLYFIGFKGVEV